MATEAEITYQGLESWRIQNNSAENELLTYWPEEPLTAAGAASTFGVTLMNSASAAVNVTLADGVQIGQQKLFVMTDASNSSTITVAHHVTSDPEVFTCAQVGDTLLLLLEPAGPACHTGNKTCFYRKMEK